MNRLWIIFILTLWVIESVGQLRMTDDRMKITLPQFSNDSLRLHLTPPPPLERNDSVLLAFPLDSIVIIPLSEEFEKELHKQAAKLSPNGEQPLDYTQMTPAMFVRAVMKRFETHPHEFYGIPNIDGYFTSGMRPILLDSGVGQVGGSMTIQFDANHLISMAFSPLYRWRYNNRKRASIWKYGNKAYLLY